MRRLPLFALLGILSLTFVPDDATGQATISEEIRSIQTYPFSEPDAVPILSRDARLYPYHAFEGYSHESEPMDWKVVTLENEYIQVFVLPEVGGKVWGAIEKKTGKEFIYRNEVMKFRNIALRGPWTSGGIEFNFGVIGHTPATATPVNYKLVENQDGSVSCFVGSTDLPSRTTWTVEIRLPAESAFFETNVTFSNPTSLEQPYYNWVTAAAFAREDLVMSIPGDQYLKHSGEVKDWPIDEIGRDLAPYANNTFESHKSYHVVGEVDDYFGGYYEDADWGFGQWARYEDMPGQKLWLWSLARDGGVWEDLLTDTDGQYVEFQAGRMFVQYSPGDHDNPITKAAFEPMATDKWSQRWFPVMGTGGISDASDKGVMHVVETESGLTVSLNAFEAGDVTLLVTNGSAQFDASAALTPLEPLVLDLPPGTEVSIPELDLFWSMDRSDVQIERPFETDPDARSSQNLAEQDVFAARELIKARRYVSGRSILEGLLMDEAWNRDALVELASLDLREGHFERGLQRAHKALQLDAHDAKANFIAGTIYQTLGQDADARDAFAWAARSLAYRSAANTHLAEIALRAGRYEDAMEFSLRAAVTNAWNVDAAFVQAATARHAGEDGQVEKARLLDIDPLNRFAQAETFLSDGNAEAFLSFFNTEFADEDILEMVIRYASLGLKDDALRLLDAWRPRATDPMVGVWEAYLREDTSLLNSALELGNGMANPWRVESLPVLEWAMSNGEAWQFHYWMGLNLWALNRASQALPHWTMLANWPDQAAFYVARAQLAWSQALTDPVPDLEHALTQPDADRMTHVYLIRHLQEEMQWEASMDAILTARAKWPTDFVLALHEAKAHLFMRNATDAIAIMEEAHVLPSEGGREAHALYEAAHLMRAMEAINAGDLATATSHLDHSREWPERLGQGRPYDPDERLADYLAYRIALLEGDKDAAQQFGERVLIATGTQFATPSRLNLLAPDVLRRNGFPEDADSLKQRALSGLDLLGFSLTDQLVFDALELK